MLREMLASSVAVTILVLAKWHWPEFVISVAQHDLLFGEQGSMFDSWTISL